MPGQFSRAGLGSGMAEVFEAMMAWRQPPLLREPRGRQLFVTCDIGGSQKLQRYETYSFLVMDLDRNQSWLDLRAAFRDQFFTLHRRMAFKALNDAHRRRALEPFLRLASLVNGVLVTFAIDKAERPRIGMVDEVRNELAALWKPAVADRLLWVIYLSAFLVSGLSVAGQNVMLIIDEDEVVANVSQLTKLTELFGRALSAQGGPMMGHLRCGTAKSDDGSLALEDLISIPDLAAGAVGEFTDALRRDGAGPLSRLFQRLPTTLTWKSRVIMPWLCARDQMLTRLTCVIDGTPGSDEWRASIPEWHVVDDPTRIAP